MSKKGKKKKANKNKKALLTGYGSNDDEKEELDNAGAEDAVQKSEDESDTENQPKSKKKNRRRKAKKGLIEQTEDNNHKPLADTLVESKPDDNSDFEMDAKKRKGGKKGKKTSGAEKNKATTKPNNTFPSQQGCDVDEVGEDKADQSQLRCEKCTGVFPSKNKLFQHLKTSGHAVYIPSSATAVAAAEKKPSKKQKKKL